MIEPHDGQSREANVLYRYITGHQPSPQLLTRYLNATAAFPGDRTPREQMVLGFAVRHEWALGMIDGAVALSEPRCLLRQRLLIMMALAETEPSNTALFLPCDRPFWYFFVIGFRLFWAAVKLLCGQCLLRAI